MNNSMITSNEFDIHSLINKWIEDELNGIEFPVDFEIAWQIAGYSRKDSAKRYLPKTALHKLYHISLEKSGGRPKEIITLSTDGLKHLCLMADTPEGELIRQYFIEAEKKWKAVQRLNPELAQQIELLNAQERILDKQLKLRELDNTMLLLHGKQVTLALRGYDQTIVEVEKPILEVIDKRTNDRREGMTTTQLNQYLKEQTGNSFKSGTQVKQILEKEAPELLDIVQRPVNQDWVLKENVDKAIEILKRKQPKQLLLGQ